VQAKAQREQNDKNQEEAKWREEEQRLEQEAHWREEEARREEREGDERLKEMARRAAKAVF